jgi:type I restriction enzyme S subunit
MNELLTKGIGHKDFKDSELGRIPKSWEVSVVKNSIFDMTSGWSPDCLPDPAVGSQWGILKTTSVTWSGFDINENKALPVHLEGRAQISLKAGDVLVTRAGPIDRVGVVAFCKQTYPKIMLSDKIIRIQTKSDELLGEFLSVWLGSYAAQKNMRSKISGMAEAQSNISQDILKSIPLPLPSLSEQKQIIQILRSLDFRIRAQKNKINQTRSLKKSLMQDLLTGKVRVKVN